MDEQRAEGPKASSKRQKKLSGKRSLKGITATILAIFVAVVAGIILEVTQPWITSQPAATIQDTKVIFYEPWNTSNPNGNTLSNVHVAHIFSGYCWLRSLATNRSDAYRCISHAGNLLLDPCFVSPFLSPSSETQVACPYPSPGSVTVLRLNRPLSNISTAPYKSTPPSSVWLLVLADGTRCFAATGTTNVIAGELRQNYYECPGSRYSLYGYPQHSSNLWTILEQKDGSSDITAVPIAEAYY